MSTPVDAESSATDAGPGSIDDQPAPARQKTFGALALYNYRLYFSGQVISNTGTWMQRIAQDWLVLEITNSSFAVGITTALQFLPMLLFGLWGGVIADRYSKRSLLIGTQVIMGLLAVALSVLTLTGHVHVWHIYLIAGLLGLVAVVDTPTRQTFVNEMVPQSLVRNAVSLNSACFQLARMAGPAVAGLVINAVGSGWAFAFNAISYGATIAGLVLMRTDQLQRLPMAPRKRGQVREGLAYVRARPNLLWIIVTVFFIGTFGYNWAIFLSAYAKNVFHSGADVYGLLNTVIAVGSVVGAVLAARRSNVRMAWLFGLGIGFGVLMVLDGAVHWIVPFVIVLMITGAVSLGFSTTANSTVQLSTDAAIRGRVMSLYMLVFAGGTPIGSPIMGAITQHWGPAVAMIVSGVICAVATGVCAVLAARQTGTRVRLDLHRGAERHVLVQRIAMPAVPAGAGAQPAGK